MLLCKKKTARKTELNVLWHSTGFPSGFSFSSSVVCIFLCVSLWWIKQGLRLLFASHIGLNVIRKEEKKA
jgi:hypothetical protein